MIRFRKEHIINSNVDDMWRLFTDLHEVTNCIPNLENLQIEKTKFKAYVKPPFSFIKGKFKIETEIIEFKEKESLTIDVRGSSIGASFNVKLVISISSPKIGIDIMIETYGLLKPIPQSLIQKVVEDIETHMLKCIKEKLEH